MQKFIILRKCTGRKDFCDPRDACERKWTGFAE